MVKKLIEFNGEAHSVAEWARRIGMSRRGLGLRLKRKNWTIEQALTTGNDERPRGPVPTIKEQPAYLIYCPDNKCCIKGCDRPIQGHFFCRSHYQSWRMNGHPLKFLKRRVPSTKAKTCTKEYKTWHGAKSRCLNPTNRSYANYGGRGITMCAEWSNSFEAFLADIGQAPSQEYSLERIDVNGNYEPENCRWATWDEQNRNTRATRLTADIVATAKARRISGESVADIARDLKVPKSALYQAVLGYSWKEVEPAGSA